MVRVEDRLGFDVDDDDPAITFPGWAPERATTSTAAVDGRADG
jgi:hypothetical protein